MSISDYSPLLPNLVPQHLLSRSLGILANCRITWLKNALIDSFVHYYQVDMHEAANPDPHHYVNFNDFFTRALKPGARPIVQQANTLACPVDGTISQMGEITDGRIFQAKGFDFTTLELLGNDQKLASQFAEGSFATVYLAPRDYHRIHMPITGRLQQMIYIPGKLFSVNAKSASSIPRLFARNERVVCIFATDAGPMALILVGALIVASIHTTWAGAVKGQSMQTWQYTDETALLLQQGQQMGHFQLGSTIIMLFAKDKIAWLDSLFENTPVKLGQNIGRFTSIMQPM